MGLNDPQWGKKNNGGPPDLEALLRKLNEKLASKLGKQNNGGNQGGNAGGGAPAPAMGANFGLIATIVGAIWLGSGFYIVDPNERGVVLRFGAHVDTTNPGPNWHFPYPFETVEMVDLTQVRTVSVGYRNDVKNKVMEESLMLTQDENIVDIQFDVQYTLSDAAAFLFNNRNPEEMVRQLSESAIREMVGKNKMDFVLYEGREQVGIGATKLLQDMLDKYQAGIVVSKIILQNAQPPEEVQAAFDDAVKAGLDRERLKNEGQAYANDLVPKARGTAERLLQEAEGYKQRVIANAEGEAQRFDLMLEQYQKAPVVTRERLYLDMMQEVMSSVSKVMVDQKNGNSLLYLPLDKLVEASRNGGAAAAPVAAEPLPLTEAPVRGSGTLSRDREVR